MRLRLAIATYAFTTSKPVMTTGSRSHARLVSWPRLPSSTVHNLDVWTWDEAEGWVLPQRSSFLNERSRSL
jgi:hypothetical protein